MSFAWRALVGSPGLVSHEAELAEEQDVQLLCGWCLGQAGVQKAFKADVWWANPAALRIPRRTYEGLKH